MAADEDLTGSTIAGKYDLLRLIRSGMGTVYEARAKSTHKRCAVKLLPKSELASDAELTRRFFREARASGSLQSEHVVTTFDSGIDDEGRPYYVMEYLVGEDLSQTLERTGALHPATATKVAYQAALGLAKAHEANIVHRDVKPSNLFLVSGDDGEIKVKVLDFGVAKVRGDAFDESESSLTRSGSFLGTPRYMAPEQVRGASAIDARADVWSLGIVLYECLANRSPWATEASFGSVIAAILTAEVPPIQDVAPWVESDLAVLVERSLSRDPAQRPPNAGALLQALKPLLHDGGRLAASDVRPPTDQERSRVAPRLSLADTVMSNSTPGTPPVSKTRGWARRTLPLVAASGLVLGVTAWRLTARPDPGQFRPRSLPSALAAVAALAPTPAAAPEPRAARFMLKIVPPGVKVVLDGNPVVPNGGLIAVEGELGSTHLVELSRAGRNTRHRVALTADGLVPATLEWPASPRADATFAPRTEPRRERATAANAPPLASAVPANRGPALSVEFE